MASFSPSCCSAAKNKAPPLPSCHGAPDCCSAGLQTPLSQPLVSQKHSELSARPSVPLLILLMQEVLFKATFAGGLHARRALNSAGVCLLIKKKERTPTATLCLLHLQHQDFVLFFCASKQHFVEHLHSCFPFYIVSAQWVMMRRRTLFCGQMLVGKW